MLPRDDTPPAPRLLGDRRARARGRRSPRPRAPTADAAARSTARKLGQEAVKLYEAGDYAGALEKFNTADSLVPAPTLGLYAARCLAKLGRTGRGVGALPRGHPHAARSRRRSPVMRKAQADAVAEREKLLPTIPTRSR